MKSAQPYVPKHLYLHLQLSTTANFASQSKTASDIPFCSWPVYIPLHVWHLLPLSLSASAFYRYSLAMTGFENLMSHTVSEMLIPSHWSITIFPLPKSLISAAFPVTYSHIWQNDDWVSSETVPTWSHTLHISQVSSSKRVEVIMIWLLSTVY